MLQYDFDDIFMLVSGVSSAAVIYWLSIDSMSFTPMVVSSEDSWSTK